VRRVSTNQAQIHLASIPFIRLRRILGDRLAEDGWRYCDEVRRAQEELEFLEAAHIVRLNYGDQSVSVGGRKVELTPRMFFTYALFAGFQQIGRGQGGFVSPGDITLDDLDLLYRIVTRRGRYGHKLYGIAVPGERIEWE